MVRQKQVIVMILSIFLVSTLPIIMAYSNGWETCKPSSSWCGEDDKIMGCSSDGEKFFEIKTCGSGEICKLKNYEPICVNANEDSNLSLYIIIGLVLIILLILVLILISRRKK